MNRRNFLQFLGLGAAGIALGAKIKLPTTPSTAINQDLLPDVNAIYPLGNTGDIKLTTGTVAVYRTNVNGKELYKVWPDHYE
jgi:hypothetical protein